MNYIPKKPDLSSFLKDLKKDKLIKFTQSFAERISESGDIAGSPFAHWRWKKDCIADMIIWPKTEEEIISILKLANTYQIPITPRGAGTDYYGSGVSAYGGIILDLKQMNKFDIDTEKQYVILQAGVCFNNAIEALNKVNYQLCSYPTSALSSTIGGWIGTGGLTGVGTYKYGSFINQMIQLKVISPTGELKILNQQKEFEIYFGTCGIFGIITEITLKIIPKEEKIPLVFGFNDLLNIINIIKGLNSKNEVLLIGFSDFEYELRSSGLNEYPYYIFIVLAKYGIENLQNKDQFIEMIRKASGEYLGDEFSNQLWENYLKSEMQLKLNTPVLMLQSIFIDLDFCPDVINLFKTLSEKRSINHYFYGLVNKDMKVRLQLFTPTDNDKIIHFLASKAILHKIIKEIYKSNKGSVYTYGMLNSIYLHKYEKDKLNDWREQKKKIDPNYILNPYKIITSKASFWRINLIFEMNSFWRIFAVKINTAQLVNNIQSDKIENKSVYKKNKGKTNGFQ